MATYKSITIVQSNNPDDSNPIKNFVGKALGLAPSLNAYWDILDVYPAEKDATPQLALAHYNENYDPLNRMHEPLRAIRGTIVDLNTGAVVCDAYGYTQTIPCYEPISETDNTINIATQEYMYINSVDVAPEETAKIKIGKRELDKTNTKLFLGYEGAMIRFFKWNNIIFFSTHRRINARNSNWGAHTPFLTLYNQLNGPDPATLFGDEPYSPYCYMFLIAHNEIRLASSTKENRIIFIGVKKVWSEEIYASNHQPYIWSGDFDIKIPSMGGEPPVFSGDINRALILQPSVNVTTANKFLFPNTYAKDIPATSGYNAKEHEIVVEYDKTGKTVQEVYFQRLPQKIMDERLAGGDFLIVYTQDASGKTLVYRLESPAFEYRSSISDNDPNLYHRFVVEMVKFTKADPKDLMNDYPSYINEDGHSLVLDKPSDRQIYWWSLFYDAIAPIYKDEVEGYYKRYANDIYKVANFIIGEYPKIIATANPQSEELKRINENTRRRIENIRAIATGTRIVGQSPFVITRNLLLKETGPSLYKMITTIKNLEKLKNAPPKVAEI